MLYVVHISVDADRLAEWTSWMYDAHIPDVLATGCFAWGVVARVPESDPARRAYRISTSRTAPTRSRYQRDHAPALQHDHTSRFEGSFSAHRELLPLRSAFSPPSWSYLMARSEALGIKRLESVHFFVNDIARHRKFWVDWLDFAQLGASSPAAADRDGQRSIVVGAGDAQYILTEPTRDDSVVGRTPVTPMVSARWSLRSRTSTRPSRSSKARRDARDRRGAHRRRGARWPGSRSRPSAT